MLKYHESGWPFYSMGRWEAKLAEVSRLAKSHINTKQSLSLTLTSDLSGCITRLLLMQRYRMTLWTIFSRTRYFASGEDSLRLEINSYYSIYTPSTSKTPSHGADAERGLLESNACPVALGDPRLLSSSSRRGGYIRAHRHLLPSVLQRRPKKSLSTTSSQCVS